VVGNNTTTLSLCLAWVMQLLAVSDSRCRTQLWNADVFLCRHYRPTINWNLLFVGRCYFSGIFVSIFSSRFGIRCRHFSNVAISVWYFRHFHILLQATNAGVNPPKNSKTNA